MVNLILIVPYFGESPLTVIDIVGQHFMAFMITIKFHVTITKYGYMGIKLTIMIRSFQILKNFLIITHR